MTYNYSKRLSFLAQLGMVLALPLSLYGIFHSSALLLPLFILCPWIAKLRPLRNQIGQINLLLAMLPLSGLSLCSHFLDPWTIAFLMLQISLYFLCLADVIFQRRRVGTSLLMSLGLFVGSLFCVYYEFSNNSVALLASLGGWFTEGNILNLPRLFDMEAGLSIKWELAGSLLVLGLGLAPIFRPTLFQASSRTKPFSLYFKAVSLTALLNLTLALSPFYADGLSLSLKWKTSLYELAVAHSLELNSSFLSQAVLDKSAKVFTSAGKTAQTIHALAMLSAISPDDPERRFRLAAHLARFGSDKMAKRIFSGEDFSLEKLQPVNATDAYFLSELWRDRNKPEQVFRDLETWTLINSDDSEEQEFLDSLTLRAADYALSIGKQTEALRLVDALLTQSRKIGEALTIKAEFYYQNNKFGDMFIPIYKASKLLPDNPRTLTLLARYYHAMGEDNAIAPLLSRLRIQFPSRAWEGNQGGNLTENGQACLQTEFAGGQTRMDVALKAESTNDLPLLVQVILNDESVLLRDVEVGGISRHVFDLKLRRGLNRICLKFIPTDSSGSLKLGPGGFSPIFQDK